MVKININIQKKDLWLLSAIAVFFVGVGFVIAIGGTEPDIMGHSAGELSFDGITAGKVINFDGGDAMITVHDGRGNFNIKSGVDENHIIVAGDGGSHIEMGDNGGIYLAVSSVAEGGTFTDDVMVSVKNTGVEILGDLDVSGSISGGSSETCKTLHTFDPSEQGIIITEVVDVPSYCINSACHIILKRYTGGVMEIEYPIINTYTQDLLTGRWSRMGGEGILSNYINGDSTETYIIGNRRAGLRDDTVGSETSSNQWVYYAGEDSRAGELIVCP